MSAIDPDDPEVVACDGPTLRELRESSIDLMLQPIRRDLEEVMDAILEQAREAVDIVVAIAGHNPIEARSDGFWCRLCKAQVPLPVPSEDDQHAESCPWRRAAEWVADYPGAVE